MSPMSPIKLFFATFYSISCAKSLFCPAMFCEYRLKTHLPCDNAHLSLDNIAGVRFHNQKFAKVALKKDASCLKTFMYFFENANDETFFQHLKTNWVLKALFNWTINDVVKPPFLQTMNCTYLWQRRQPPHQQCKWMEAFQLIGSTFANKSSHFDLCLDDKSFNRTSKNIFAKKMYGGW